MPVAKSVAEALEELHRLEPSRGRRPSAVASAATLLARLLIVCRTVSVEERHGGIAFRLAIEQADVRLTCVLHRAPRVPLTAVEAAVAEQVCEGRTLAQVASLRGVSLNTIKSQLRQIFRKLEVNSRVALVRRLSP